MPTPYLAVRSWRSGSVRGVAQADAVQAPERVGVDQGPGHPGLVGRERMHHEGRLGDAQGWPAETQRAAGLEAEPGVERGRSLQEDQRLRTILYDRQRVPHQPRTDPATLVGGDHGQRAEYEHV